MVNRLLPAAFALPALLLISLSAEAFVGGIAVSIGRATNVEGAEIVPFSADAQIETEDQQMTSKVYYKPGMVRDEMNTGGMQMVTIQRFEEGKVWILMGQGMYMESKAGESEQAPEYKLVERTVVGKEDVNGMPTTKYKTVYEGPDGRFGGFTWFTDDNIAVKGFMISETNGEKQRIKWTMSNVQRGDQPDSLFQLPPGAKPMGMGSMMGGMGNMGGAGSPAGAGAANGQAGMGDMAGMMGGMGGAGQSNSGTTAPAAPAGNTQKSADSSAEDPSMAEEVATGAAQTAEDTVKQETNRSVQDSVRKGIGKLFGR